MYLRAIIPRAAGSQLQHEDWTPLTVVNGIIGISDAHDPHPKGWKMLEIRQIDAEGLNKIERNIRNRP